MDIGDLNVGAQRDAHWPITSKDIDRHCRLVVKVHVVEKTRVKDDSKRGGWGREGIELFFQLVDLFTRGFEEFSQLDVARLKAMQLGLEVVYFSHNGAAIKVVGTNGNGPLSGQHNRF